MSSGLSFWVMILSMSAELVGGGSTLPLSRTGSSLYSPGRRTAVILLGEGTGGAYLAGALKALDEAGVRFDLVMGRGAGALVAALGAVQFGEKLYEPDGLLASLKSPWRWRAPYRAAMVCLAAAFLVFLSPALAAALLLVALPLLGAARIVAPEAVASLTGRLQSQFGAWASEVDPLYLRAMAFPLALLFALLMVGWIVPSFIRQRGRGRGLAGLLGEGIIHLSPLARTLERSLWASVRGASLEARPPSRREIGDRYRDLLSGSLGQPGFREIIFYALDLDTGQEVPFALLKERWFARLVSRGPAGGAVVAEPINLAGEAGPLLFDALLASVSPPGLAPPVPLRLPPSGRHGGEVHRFAASPLAGQSAVADALAAGVEQIIYIAAIAPAGPGEGGDFEQVSAAAMRQSLENDLRWAERERPGLQLFLIRPDRQRLGLFEFRGRSLPGGERFAMGDLVRHGQRDAGRLFIQAIVGEAQPHGTPVQAEDRRVEL